MSDALQRVTLTTPDPLAPEGHDQKMIDLVDAKAAASNPPEARPAWLPEKFKTVEDMAASYAALEAKQGGAPAAAPVVAPADAPGVNPLSVPEAPAPADVAAVVQKAGLDMAALNSEFAQTGALSEASYAALATAGFDQATVNSYVAGQQALATQFQNDVKSATPGGAEKYGEMLEWAKVHLSPADIKAYNDAMATNDPARAKLAVAGLGASFTAAVGNEPVLQGGRTSAGAADVFESLAQMKVAMSDKRYKTDHAYRASVQAKLGRSAIM